MSPTGPRYPSTAADGGGINAWSNVNNILADDGSDATNSFLNTPRLTNPINATNYGFSIPSTSQILGVKVEIKRSGVNGVTDSVVSLIKGGVVTGSNKSTGATLPASDSYTSFGGPTDTWGLNLTPSDVNASNFGVSYTVQGTSSSSFCQVDTIRITVYWQTSPTEVPIQYYWQVFNNGQYVGDLPNVTTPLIFSQDINTAGSQITVKCGVSPDTAILPNSPLIDDIDFNILDENGNAIYDEGIQPIIELGTGVNNRVIRNGNKVIVTQVDYWHPNGVVVFRGTIQHWEADYGGDSANDDISVIIYSEGADMDNYLVKGSPFAYTLDQSNTSQNNFLPLYHNSIDQGSGYNFYGQSFTVGVGVTNIGAISLYLYGVANITVSLYDSPAMTTLLATVTQSVSGAPSEIQFGFGVPATVTPGQVCFFTVTAPNSNLENIYYSNANPYSGGTMYQSIYSGGSTTGTWVPMTGNDLYFKTWSSNGATTATYTNVDPTSGMLIPFMNYYNAEGGLITYTSSSISSTGLSITYKWNTNTVYEGLQGTLSVSPNGYYYTVDVGSSVLTFKAASTTADITLIKGYHIDKMTLVATIEQIINKVFLTGAQVSGTNIYTEDSDANSTLLYGPHIDRPTNNQVTDTATAHIVGSSEVKRMSSEQYMTKVTLLYHKIDFTTVKPGMIVGFAGFGTFVDKLLLQIVRIEYTPVELTLTLGILPKRLHRAVEQTVRGYIGLQTVSNPTSPS